jgi:hypothetical protein
MSLALHNALLLLASASMHNAAVTATTNSVGVDISAMEGIVEVGVAVPLVSGTTPTLDITIQTSDVLGSGYVTAVKTDGTNAVFAQMTVAAALQKVLLDSNSLKKFVRLSFVVSGTTPSFALNANVRGANKVQ